MRRSAGPPPGGRGRRHRPGPGADPGCCAPTARHRSGLRGAAPHAGYQGLSAAGRLASGTAGPTGGGRAGAADPRRRRHRPGGRRPLAAGGRHRLLRGEGIVDDTVLFDGEVAGVRIEPISAPTRPGYPPGAAGCTELGDGPGGAVGHHRRPGGARRDLQHPHGETLDVLWHIETGCWSDRFTGVNVHPLRGQAVSPCDLCGPGGARGPGRSAGLAGGRGHQPDRLCPGCSCS